ncbi:hypothetical protein MRX96_025794 [Rhipicephalus microplus]
MPSLSSHSFRSSCGSFAMPHEDLKEWEDRLGMALVPFSHNYHNNMANGDECNAYNERLIEVIERERPLWDLCDRNYKSRAVTDAAWRYVATVMGSTGQVGTWEPLPFKESAPDVLAPECILEDVCDELPGNQGTATSSGLPPPPKKKTEAFQIR